MLAKGSKEKRNRNYKFYRTCTIRFPILIWQPDPGAFDSLLLILSQMQFCAIPPHSVIPTLSKKIGDKNATESINSKGLHAQPMFTIFAVLQLPVRLAFEEHLLKSGQVQEIHSLHAQNIDFCSL